MATHPMFPACLSRAGRATVIATSVAAALALGLVLPQSVRADPPPSIASVQARINTLNDRLDQAVEDYDQARIQLAAAQRRALDAEHRVSVAQKRLADMHAQVSAVASAAYRGASGGGSMLTTLLGAGNPQQFVDQAAALDEIGRDQAATLQALATAEHDLADAQRAAAQELAAARSVAGKMAAHRRFIRRSISEERALLSRLQARERARLAAQRRAEAARQASLQQAALGSAGGTYHGPASGSARVAVSWAYQELGKPYEWGAAGPDAFDCSGLTMYVWAKAGVGLPHSSAAQYDSGPHVSRDALEPGDLVFFGSPIHHVGIYVGGGNMIEAPHTGAVVRVASIDRPDYAGAVRP